MLQNSYKVCIWLRRENAQELFLPSVDFEMWKSFLFWFAGNFFELSWTWHISLNSLPASTWIVYQTLYVLNKGLEMKTSNRAKNFLYCKKIHIWKVKRTLVPHLLIYSNCIICNLNLNLNNPEFMSCSAL